MYSTDGSEQLEEEEIIEKIVCNESELQDNQMREIDLDDNKKVLVIKQNGKLTAIGSKCSHYGAPLIDGALGEGRIRCPWHGACFNIQTGDIEDFPGLDSLPCFDVSIEEGVVKVRAKRKDLLSDKRLKDMSLKDSSHGEIFVIIGGGAAAQTCAETLRQNGFQGRIVMICKEMYMPYDRIKVSKNLSVKIGEIQLRERDFYDTNQIEVSLNVEAKSVNVIKKEVSLSCGNELKYDKLFIASGSSAKVPDILGNGLKNVFTLRNLSDAKSINEKLTPTTHITILGSSFIAMEAAAYCSDKVAKVTVIARGTTVFNNLFGVAIGNRIIELFNSKNVEFVMNSGIKSFLAINQEENLSAVKLLDDSIIRTDICIVGIGSELNTNFLLDSGLLINDDGSIDTNLYLETKIVDIFVGGDIANAPIYTNSNELSTIGHYSLAQHHGKIAALNMLGVKTELKAVPYFSTLLFDKCFTFTGHGKVTEIFIEGDLDALKFTAFYFDDNEDVVAMSSCQPDKSIAEFAEKLAQGYRFHKDDIEFVNENEQEIFLK